MGRCIGNSVGGSTLGGRHTGVPPGLGGQKGLGEVTEMGFCLLQVELSGSEEGRGGGAEDSMNHPAWHWGSPSLHPKSRVPPGSSPGGTAWFLDPIPALPGMSNLPLWAVAAPPHQVTVGCQHLKKLIKGGDEGSGGKESFGFATGLYVWGRKGKLKVPRVHFGVKKVLWRMK